MNRLMGMALVTAGMSVCAITSATAQTTFRIDASIPSSVARELKRHGIEVSKERVRGTVKIRDRAREGVEVRFHKAPERSRDGRVEESERAVTPAKGAASPTPPADVALAPSRAKAAEPPREEARSEAPIPPSPDVKVASLPAPVPPAPEAPSVLPDAKASAVQGPMGEWFVADGTARIGIHVCGENLCGTVTLAKEKGRVGERILRDMKPDGFNRWKGTILDPRSGKTYQSTMTLKGSSLRVDGCFLNVLCGGETWTRG